MSNLKEQLIRLGSVHPELKPHITHVLNEISTTHKPRAASTRGKQAHSNFDAQTDSMLERLLKPHGYFPGPGHVKKVDMSNRTMEMILTLMKSDAALPGEEPGITMQEAQDLAFQVAEKLGARSYDVKSSRGDFSEYEILLEFSIA